MKTSNEVLDMMRKSDRREVVAIADVLASTPKKEFNEVAEDLLGWVLALHQSTESEK